MRNLLFSRGKQVTSHWTCGVMWRRFPLPATCSLLRQRLILMHVYLLLILSASSWFNSYVNKHRIAAIRLLSLDGNNGIYLAQAAEMLSTRFVHGPVFVVQNYNYFFYQWGFLHKREFSVIPFNILHTDEKQNVIIENKIMCNFNVQFSLTMLRMPGQNPICSPFRLQLDGFLVAQTVTNHLLTAPTHRSVLTVHDSRHNTESPGMREPLEVQKYNIIE